MYRLGMGASGAFSTQCGGGLDALNPNCWYQIWPFSYFASPPASQLTATAPAPPQSVWTTPPASGEEAQQTVDTLLNQQLQAQKAINAGQVKSSPLDVAASAVQSAYDTAKNTVTSPWLWLGIGLGVFALVSLSAGSPRRYGR